MINFSNILSSIGVVAGNLTADNKYDFYYGIEWSDGSFTYNEYEFYEKSGFDSQYDFFQNYADSQYDFYRDIDSPGVIDQYSFFKNGGQFFNLSPVASFTTSSYNKVDDTFSFTNTSVNADTYSWDFGDGNTSTQTNPTHTYVTAGDYTVELTASEGGLNPSTHTLVVKVYDYNVEFTSVNNQLEVTFTNTTTATNVTIDQYDWDFGDGNTSTDTNPIHTYAADGTYTVNLMTYFSIDGDTISDGTNKQVTVNSYPTNGIIGNNNNKITLTDGDNIIRQSSQMSGDMKRFAQDGKGTIIGTIQQGSSSSYTKIVRSTDWGETFTETTSSYVLQSGFVSYLKSLDRWVIVCSSLASTKRSEYSDDGGLTWTQGATFNAVMQGGSWSEELGKLVMIEDFGDLQVSTNGINWIQISTSISRARGCNWIPSLSKWLIGDITTNEVWFYDGSSFSSTSVSTDIRDITYSVELDRMVAVSNGGTIWYSDDQGSSFTSLGVIGNTLRRVSWSHQQGLFLAGYGASSWYSPDGINWTQSTDVLSGFDTYDFGQRYVDFSENTTVGTVGSEITFTSISYGEVDATAYSWDFGDGNTSTLENPTHTYATAGTYTVTHGVENAFGISEKVKTDLITITPLPNVTSLTTTDIQDVEFTYSFDPEPSMDGYNVEYKEVGGTVSNNNNSLTVTGLTAETNYEYRVQWYLGTYNGSWSSWIPVLTTPEPTFVEATGGTVTTITDGGVNYKVHTFSSGGTFDVTSGGVIEYLVVGRGANGGNGTGNSSSGGGGSGGQVLSLNEGISVSSYTISIGSTTSFNGQSLGTGGGVGGGSPVSGSSNGNSGSNGTTSDINGSSYTYGSSGGSGASQVFAGRSTTYYGGGGGSGAGNGAHVYRYDGSCESGGSANGYGGGGGGGSAGRASSCNGPGGSGNNGVVIIRYETA